MLDRYENLYVDYSWIVFESFICPGNNPDPDWLELTEEHSEKICIGTDVVNKFEYIPHTIQKYDTLLDALSNTARQNIAYNTAYRLFNEVKA